ncbi:MAG: ABC transporter permease [Cetobacterium sp.]
MKGYIMNKKYLTTIFCIISLVITLLINCIISAYVGYKLMNPFANKNSKIISISSKNSENNIIDVLKKYDNTAVYIDQINIDVCYGQAIYYNNYNNNIPMINGKFLSNDDFLNDECRSIVIGKDLEKYVKIYTSTGKKVIRIQDIDYDVIGVMGYENQVSILDSRFFININGFLHSNPINNNTRMNLTTNQDTQSELLKDLDKSFNDISVEDNNNNSNMVSQIALNSKNLIAIVVIMVILFILNIINITSYYIKDKLKEIGIRKSYGARQVNIFKNILKDYLLVVTIGNIISLLIYAIIIKSNMSAWLFGSGFYILPIIVTYTITTLIGVLIAIIVLAGCNKYPMNILIKGV